MNKIMHEMNVREDFAIYKSNPDLVYLDSSSTTLVPKVVISAVSNFLQKTVVSSRRGAYNLAVRGGEIVEKVRKKIASKLGIANHSQISFQGNVSSAITSIGLGYDWKSEKKNSILISEAEHNSIMLPLRRVAEILDLNVKLIKTDQNGVIDQNDFAKKISNDTGIIAISDRVFGTDKLNPMNVVSDMAHDANAILLTEVSSDVAFTPNYQFTKHADIAFWFANRSYMAPPGITLQWVSSESAEKIKPGILGSNSVSIVNELSFETALPPDKFESGILPLSHITAIGQAIEYTTQLQADGLKKHIQNLSHQIIDSMENIPSLVFYGNPTQENNSILFTLGQDSGVSCHDIALFLNESNIAVRSGLLCAPLLVKKFDNNGVIQVSFQGYNTQSDVEKVSSQLQKIARQLL